MTISPFVNTDIKGGAYPIMLQQFNRAIGVAIVRDNTKHKPARLHYEQSTAEEAADEAVATAKAHHSSNRWKPIWNNRTSWFS